MEVVPLVDEGLGNSAYVVDLGDGGALIVDPQRDPRPYLREMERRALAPRFVAETHLHADFVSGGRELPQPARRCWPRPAAVWHSRIGGSATAKSWTSVD
ncbi:MAG: hypothetical protein ACR2KP_18355 [Egibacteraceae bacterium]